MSETVVEETHGNGEARRVKPTAAPAEEAAPPADRIPFYRRRAFIVFFVITAVLGIAAFVYWLHARHFESTDDAFIEGRVIPIAPQVAALVVAVRVNDNQFVHAGDLLVELDPIDYQAALAQAKGLEAAAKGKLEQARAGVPGAESVVAQAQAELEAAQVSLENADQDLRRYNGLDQRARSQQQLDAAVKTQKVAQAQVQQAKAKLGSAQTQVASAKASVIAAEGDYQKAQADTSRAQINLGYCRITAPVDGRITSKSVEVGMYVSSANPLFSIVPKDVWVIANFKETQLDLIRPGLPVQIRVDAYPDREFRGTVQSIQVGTGSRFSMIPAENATGNFVKVVQRVPVKITFEGDVNSNPNQPLAPGMSAEPTVRVSEGSF